ncbi:hypothetical protein BY996DRAFT_6736552 [Phakopsora pachyrhizi]|nr:hypothetical protein BY996DRAFT_7111844 [Phakopsora pachyrhizi]KAI8459247.1 hypothetical protein BY996DRAFT_6799637 [Phakopsora pachyrhizi]KAI8460322.1 hypothetical protein BY996DRAFT_6736552 [Phakopsora pachyrhizi]
MAMPYRHSHNKSFKFILFLLVCAPLIVGCKLYFQIIYFCAVSCLYNVLLLFIVLLRLGSKMQYV